MGRQPMMRFHRARIAEVTRPTYDTEAGHETVSLISILKDESGKDVGKLEVAIRFDYLMEDIIQLGWWQSEMACLVDDSEMCLADSKIKGRRQLGETNDPVELAILKALKEKPFGTLRGPGHPPDKVAGFYRIQQAPWSIVLFGPGRKILAPKTNSPFPSRYWRRESLTLQKTSFAVSSRFDPVQRGEAGAH